VKLRVLSLIILASSFFCASSTAGAKVAKPNPCTQAPVAGSAQSYHGCNFVKLGAGAPSFAGQNLSGFDFTLANMQNLDLHGANLSGANLSHANLSGANLENVFVTGSTQANDLLSHVNFGKADLKNADFSGSYNLFSNFSGADLTNINFTNAYLDHTVLATSLTAGIQLSGVQSMGIAPPRGGLNLPAGFIVRKGVILYCSSKYVCGAP
jgi:uncharacterized protein YjbI with pentapeptide repeats